MRIAYTARIPEWALTAIEDWFSYCLTLNWYEINLEHGIGTPFVSLNCDFRAPVTPRYPLKMPVYVAKLGDSSLSHYVEGFQNDVLCFSVRSVVVFVSAPGKCDPCRFHRICAKILKTIFNTRAEHSTHNDRDQSPGGLSAFADCRRMVEHENPLTPLAGDSS